MNVRTRNTLIALAIGALAISLGGIAAAQGATVKVPSAVTIAVKQNSLNFHGKVKTSSYQPCEQQRKVKLYKVISGGPDQVVGKDTTSNNGAWSITPQGSAGISLATFYAKTSKLSQGTAGTIYVCNAGSSKQVKPSS